MSRVAAAAVQWWPGYPPAPPTVPGDGHGTVGSGTVV